MNLNTIHCGDALDFLCTLPDESVNCTVTSPPYFNLRDYGVAGQLGGEQTPGEYVAHLAAVFAEVKRVLRADGVAWLNLGDSYVGATSEYAEGGSAGKNARASTKTLSGLPTGSRGARNRALYEAGLQMKSLIGIPWRVAFALMDDGWILRNEVIWHKPNPMPSSARDRLTVAHETIFLLVKSPRYWYDAEAIAEPAQDCGERDRTNGKYHNPGTGLNPHRGLIGTSKQLGGGDFSKRYADAQPQHGGDSERKPYLTRNKRDVWKISTAAFPGSHFATFPEALVEPMLLAGCPKEGVVLDPFFGAGTVGVVAQRLGRNWIGCDINPEYVDLARHRIDGRLQEYLARERGEAYSAYLFEDAR